MKTITQSEIDEEAVHKALAEKFPGFVLDATRTAKILSKKAPVVAATSEPMDQVPPGEGDSTAATTEPTDARLCEICKTCPAEGIGPCDLLHCKECAAGIELRPIEEVAA